MELRSKESVIILNNEFKTNWLHRDESIKHHKMSEELKAERFKLKPGVTTQSSKMASSRKGP